MESWRIKIGSVKGVGQSQVIANSNHLDEEQDPDPHNSDTEPQYCKKDK